MIALQSGKALWYATRGTGVVALLLLTASVVLGIITSVRFETRHWPRFVVGALHRNVSLLVVVFVALHVITTVQDAFAPIHYLDAVVPFASPYRTVWLGLGAVAADLLLALVVTSLLRARLGYRVWRFVHWAAYISWPVALVHSLGTGSDARATWSIALNAVVLTTVLCAIAWRFTAAWRTLRTAGIVAATTAVLAPAVIVLWAWRGPLQPGWAHTARPTVRPPASAELGTTGGQRATITAAPSPSETQGFHGALRANRTVGQVASDGSVVIAIRGTIHADPVLHLDLELHGAASGGGVVLDVGKVALGPAGDVRRWTGVVSSLNGTHVEARVADRSHHVLVVSMQLEINRAAGTVTGTVSARRRTGGNA